jgi:hypothetical protein
VTTVTAPLTNGAYGYPKGAALRQRATILACLHQGRQKAPIRHCGPPVPDVKGASAVTGRGSMAPVRSPL